MAGLPSLEERVAAIEAALAALKAGGAIPSVPGAHKIGGVATPRVYAQGPGRSRTCTYGPNFGA